MYCNSATVLCGSLFLLTASQLGIDAGFSLCPEGWTPYGCFCYIKFTDTKFTWLQAYQTCESLGSQMLTLNAPGETAFANNLIRSHYHGYNGMYRRVWLGCQKINNALVCHDQASGILELQDTGLVDCIALAPFVDATTVKRACDKSYLAACRKVRSKVVSRCNAVTTPYCLTGHAHSVTPVDHPIQCCTACHKDPKCRSFNLLGGRCQLNNVTMSQVGNDYQWLSTADEGCVYYEKLE